MTAKTPKSANGLTGLFVRNVVHSGRTGADKYGDQHGLILRVLPSGSKQWIWRGTVGGKRVDLGLGGYPYVTLAEARQKAFEHRRTARAGEDPRLARRASPKFEEAAETVIAIHRQSWRPGGKSEGQWRASLRDYAMPRLGAKGVDEITTADVMDVLLPIWSSKPETARRVRQRIGAIMKWAVAQGYRESNPAGDAIGSALPRHGTGRRHFRALPHGEVGAALEAIRASRAWPATKLAFEFLVLTAARSGEVRHAMWKEMDLGAETWTVPGDRMKSGRTHRVPLTSRAIDVLGEARRRSGGDGLVFPSPTNRVLSASTLSKLLRENGVAAVPHGFRTSFRVWCGDTGVAREVAEAALAHVVRDKVEAAYARGTLFARRREVMERWARYLSEPVCTDAEFNGA
ncbi:integrase arm-type DNA-binding domain-containing protein [Candidatus Palauibacter soopunensis]|uniref:tyrosine-type recombinase/integrase n=1 Tax=Candidatus Palauibacter soopunensis TaxID=3056739 RepID=UPI002398174E|nr:integrase arm-type DNA-binding domain-containing protein [Candidatus Palauibacter soopunensis]MDE2879535.1 integrase arm-type DNA-binding domain-containing protein [Candidatus Palauibacter soopunensis]